MEVLGFSRHLAKSARSMRIASVPVVTSATILGYFASARSMRIASGSAHRIQATQSLCLSTFHADCIQKQSSGMAYAETLPQHVPCGLHLRCPQAVPDSRALPQHVPCGLHPRIGCTMPTASGFASARSMRIASAHMHKNIRGLCKTCCELVDSFSDTQKFVSALAIFPYPSAAKATYVAICGSLGRTIDRFCGANCT